MMLKVAIITKNNNNDAKNYLRDNNDYNDGNTENNNVNNDAKYVKN